ncbi:unnamed protein product, partial [Cladocopium goreaui]
MEEISSLAQDAQEKTQVPCIESERKIRKDTGEKVKDKAEQTRVPPVGCRKLALPTLLASHEQEVQEARHRKLLPSGAVPSLHLRRCRIAFMAPFAPDAKNPYRNRHPARVKYVKSRREHQNTGISPLEFSGPVAEPQRLVGRSARLAAPALREAIRQSLRDDQDVETYEKFPKGGDRLQWIHTSTMLSDVLTKRMKADSMLQAGCVLGNFSNAQDDAYAAVALPPNFKLLDTFAFGLLICEVFFGLLDGVEECGGLTECRAAWRMYWGAVWNLFSAVKSGGVPALRETLANGGLQSLIADLEGLVRHLVATEGAHAPQPLVSALLKAAASLLCATSTDVWQ